MASPVGVRAQIEIRVDANVELASILCRLAEFDEYQATGIAHYDRAVEDHFGRFKEHPSVDLLRRLRQDRGIGYGAALVLALAAEPTTWAERVALEPFPDWIDDNWDSESARAFLQAAEAFARDTDAAMFFESQEPRYSDITRQLMEGLEGRLDVSWFDRRFGRNEGRRFILVAALLTGRNNYGPHLEWPDGRAEFFQILGTPTMGDGHAVNYPIDQVRSLIVHEMAHPFVNQWVDAHATELRGGAYALFKAVELQLPEPYRTWEIMTYESLVRATALMYFADHGEETLRRKAIQDDVAKGFLWTDDLARALEGLSFDKGATKIVDSFDTWGRNADRWVAAKMRAIEEEEAARQARGPQIVSLTPAHGDLSVDPSVQLLEIHFDRPMLPSAMVLGDVPDVTGPPAWDDAHRTLRVPVALTAGAGYRILLNSDDAPEEGFRSEKDEVLTPRTWEFEVRPR